MHYSVVHEERGVQLARILRPQDRSGTRSAPAEDLDVLGSRSRGPRMAGQERRRKRSGRGPDSAEGGRFEVVRRSGERRSATVGESFASGAAAVTAPLWPLTRLLIRARSWPCSTGRTVGTRSAWK